jgi:hypothetical protein
MEKISSRENQKIKDILLLMASRRARRQSGRFAFEGVKLALDALDAGICLERLFLTEQALQRSEKACMRLREATANAFDLRRAGPENIDTETRRAFSVNADAAAAASAAAGRAAICFSPPCRTGQCGGRDPMRQRVRAVRGHPVCGLSRSVQPQGDPFLDGRVFRAAAEIVPSLKTAVDSLRKLGD